MARTEFIDGTDQLIGVRALARLVMVVGLLTGCDAIGIPPIQPTPSAEPTPPWVIPDSLRTPGAASTRVAASPSPAGTLRLAGEDPESLDPALTQDANAWGYLLQVYSGLVRLDDNLAVVPDIAESWKVSADGRVYTFRLREDVSFHDGKKVTAADILFSIDRALSPQTGSPTAATYLGDIVGAQDRLTGRAPSVSGLRAPDDRTIEITIDTAKPYFLAKLTYPTSFVVDRSSVAKSADWHRKPNGTGPFRLERWDTDARLVLAANRGYYGGSPKLARVEYRLEPGSAMSWYENNEIDAVTVGPANVERVTDPRGPLIGQLRRVPQLSISYIGFNVRAAPFDDPKVRQAFAAATDRDRLSKVTFKGMRVPAAGIIPPGIVGYDSAFTGIPFDPAAARRYIAESSYKSADALPPISLTVGPGSGGYGESLAEMYARNLGVTIDVQVVQEGYFAGLNSRAYQMFSLGWVADYPDPQDFLDVLLHSESEANHGGFSDPAFDRLVVTARTELDPVKRIALYRQAEQRAIELAPIIPLAFDTDYVLVKPTVADLVWTPLGPLSFREVSVTARK